MIETLDELRDKEIILAGSYYENFKFQKDLAQVMGGTHPRVITLGDEVHQIQKEWHEVKEKIKEYE